MRVSDKTKQTEQHKKKNNQRIFITIHWIILIFDDEVGIAFADILRSCSPYVLLHSSHKSPTNTPLTVILNEETPLISVPRAHHVVLLRPQTICHSAARQNHDEAGRVSRPLCAIECKQK